MFCTGMCAIDRSALTFGRFSLRPSEEAFKADERPRKDGVTMFCTGMCVIDRSALTFGQFSLRPSEEARQGR